MITRRHTLKGMGAISLTAASGVFAPALAQQPVKLRVGLVPVIETTSLPKPVMRAVPLLPSTVRPFSLWQPEICR